MNTRKKVTFSNMKDLILSQMSKHWHAREGCRDSERCQNTLSKKMVTNQHENPVYAMGKQVFKLTHHIRFFLFQVLKLVDIIVLDLRLSKFAMHKSGIFMFINNT